ncbi:hypothetical protein SPBRAN_1483 [uncultured Candidatus Thioglobus sp.]|nr:hypothetical protein SPBRAN_1483 [uncultured Candidatus Thioglobus sp.]
MRSPDMPDEIGLQSLPADLHTAVVLLSQERLQKRGQYCYH